MFLNFENSQKKIIEMLGSVMRGDAGLFSFQEKLTHSNDFFGQN